MNSVEELRALLGAQQPPVCARLTPFQLLEADLASGRVLLRFEEQPAFRNHFGHIQGGFAVAMLDVCISLAAYAKLRLWLPTIELKTSFLAPLPVGVCTGEGQVLRAGRSVVFLEGKLWGSGEQPSLHATATAVIPAAQ